MKKYPVTFLATLLTLFLTEGVMAGEKIKIGAIFSITGGQASLDIPGLRGAQLGAKRINLRGGVIGREIELIHLDGKTQIPAVKDAMSRLINEYKVVAVIGLNDSSYALAAGPIAQRAGITFLTSGATLPSLPAEVGNCMFLTAFGDDAQAHAAALYAHKALASRTAWVLTDSSSDFTLALSNFFKEKFKELAGVNASLLEDIYHTGDRDFSSQIGRLKALSPQPDLLMVSALPSDCGVIVKQVRDGGIETPILSGDGFDTPLLLKVAGSGCRNVFFATHVSFENKSPVVQDFKKAYKQEYGGFPENAFSALGYDSLGLIATAMKRADSVKPEAIRDAMAHIKGFKGVTATIGYAPGKRVPEKAVTIIKVEDQTFRFAEEIAPPQI
jgi:branched-chain amino acid transport system substrate-binding protein